MRWLKYGYALSAVAHVAAYFGMSEVHEPKLPTSEVSVIVSQPKKKDKPKEPEPPPKPIEAPKSLLKRAPPKPANTPPPVPAPAPDPVAQAHPAMAALPDFGISLSGGGPGGGIAVPTGDPRGRPAAANAPAREKILSAASAAGDADQAEFVKAKPLGFVQPSYTDDARAAGVEGRVRLMLSIDASGTVTDAKVMSGLGHGLDQAAIAAARRMQFTPATRGGVAVASTFVISMRFVLGE